LNFENRWDVIWLLTPARKACWRRQNSLLAPYLCLIERLAQIGRDDLRMRDYFFRALKQHAAEIKDEDAAGPRASHAHRMLDHEHRGAGK